MWRFTDEGNLENKLRTWTFHSESSKFDPEDGEEGYIEVIDINKVLTFESGKLDLRSRKHQSIQSRGGHWVKKMERVGELLNTLREENT